MSTVKIIQKKIQFEKHFELWQQSLIKLRKLVNVTVIFFFWGVKSVHSEQQSLLTVKTTVYSNKLHFVSAVKEVGYLLPLFFFFFKEITQFIT